MPEMARERDHLFPSHMFHCRFTATGRAGPIRPEKSPEKFIIVLINTDVGTSWAKPVPQERRWWNTANATIELPQLNLDPILSGVAAQWTEQTDSAKKPTTPEVQEGKIEEFLEQIYSLAHLNDVEGATDQVFDYIDRLLCDGEFDVCDEILRRLTVEKLPTPLMRSFLTITNAAKERLPSRKALYFEIDRRMVELKGENKAKRIIGKLA